MVWEPLLTAQRGPGAATDASLRTEQSKRQQGGARKTGGVQEEVEGEAGGPGASEQY